MLFVSDGRGVPLMWLIRFPAKAEMPRLFRCTPSAAMCAEVMLLLQIKPHPKVWVRDFSSEFTAFTLSWLR